MSRDLETVECVVLRESGAAFELQDSIDSSRKAWFPKSQISFSRRNLKTGKAVAEIPLWLLKAKGWDQ